MTRTQKYPRMPSVYQWLGLIAAVLICNVALGIWVHRVGACNVDWGATAAWAQAILLLVAAIIAGRQLITFNANERTKTTLNLVDSYSTAMHEVMPNVRMSVAMGLLFVQNGAQKLAEYKV